MSQASPPTQANCQQTKIRTPIQFQNTLDHLRHYSSTSNLIDWAVSLSSSHMPSSDKTIKWTSNYTTRLIIDNQVVPENQQVDCSKIYGIIWNFFRRNTREHEQKHYALRAGAPSHWKCLTPKILGISWLVFRTKTGSRIWRICCFSTEIDQSGHVIGKRFRGLSNASTFITISSDSSRVWKLGDKI